MPIWLAGGCNILVRKFDPEAFANMLERFGGFTFAVPTMLSDMVAQGRGSGTTKLRGIMVSGAPIRPATALQAAISSGTCYTSFMDKPNPCPWPG